MNAGYLEEACHAPDASRITISETILKEAFFSVSNEMSPILVTPVLGNDS